MSMSLRASRTRYVLIAVGFIGFIQFLGLAANLTGSRRSEDVVAESSVGQEHPILGLMRDAELKWKEIYDSQSKTLEEAVSNYVKTYNRRPPAGFAEWFKYAQEVESHFTDTPFLLLEPTIAVFSGMSPDYLRSEIDELHKRVPVIDRFSRDFTTYIEDGQCKGRSQDTWYKIQVGARSGWEFCEAIKDIVHLLPDIPPFVFNANDQGNQVMSWDEKAALMEHTKAGTRAPADYTVPEPYYPAPTPDQPIDLDDHKLETPYLAYAQSCPPGSPATRFYLNPFDGEVHWNDSTAGYALSDEQGGFVTDFEKMNDVCQNAELRYEHAEFLQYTRYSKIVQDTTRLPKKYRFPVFSQSKHSTQTDFLIPQVYNYEYLKDWGVTPWHEKENRFVWRGMFSGVQYTTHPELGGDWRATPRAVLHEMCTNGRGLVNYVWSDNGTLSKGTTLKQKFMETYLDCGINQFAQVNDATYDDGKPTLETVPLRYDMQNVKLIGDVDGFGWSGRFRSLLHSGSAIVKSTAYQEHWVKHLIPWYHYIPMRADSSDLPSIIMFFLSHDDAAKSIADRGHEFADKHWRKEDKSVYLWRLLLEYRRIMSPPGEMDYMG